uniref:hypothetical protein n=1 Tax=Escherichia coli TaxID=562 RepID=UPI001CBDE644
VIRTITNETIANCLDNNNIEKSTDKQKHNNIDFLLEKVAANVTAAIIREYANILQILANLSSISIVSISLPLGEKIGIPTLEKDREKKPTLKVKNNL